MAGPSRIVRIAATLIISTVGALAPPLLGARAQLSHVPTPAYITFDGDTPGSAPATGGINQPTRLLEGFATLYVLETALGIDTQPVFLSLNGPEPILDVLTNFSPVSSGIVRVEATISLDVPGFSGQLVDGLLFGAGGDNSLSPDLFSLSWQRTSSDSPVDIRGFGSVAQGVGSVENNDPFRIRIDIDLIQKTWSVAIDDELNGFDDDNAVLGAISPDGIFGTVHAIFRCSCIDVQFPVDGSAAYDDISVSVNGITVVPLDIVDKSINVCNKSPIKAAALGRPFSDTTDIDPATMTLAGAPIRTVGKDETPQAKAKDTDHDGNPDLEGMFVSQDLGLTSQDQFAILQAETFDNEPVEGLDAVTVRELM